MIDYLFQCAGLTLVALLAIACLRSAPARWRLRAVLVALFVTTLPWMVLPAIPIPATGGPTPVLDSIVLLGPLAPSQLDALPASVAPAVGWQFPTVRVLSMASALGLTAFVFLALRQRSILRRWRDIARDGDHLLDGMPEIVQRNCRVRILPRGTQAAVTGFLDATVWVGEEHLNHERRTSVLLHELMHVHRRHPQLAVVLTFLRCLFWWQPLVWLWVWLARRELEHDCDEACAELLGRDRYRTTLASLIREASPQPGLALMGRRSFNLRRVRRLEKLGELSLRHRIAATAALCLTPFLVLDVSVEAEDDDGLTRAELVEKLEQVAVGAGKPAGAIMTSSNGLIGFYFDTNLTDALRSLADNGAGPIYIHPDVASIGKVRLTVAGDHGEVIRAVAENVGLAANSYPIGTLVADESMLTSLDWVDRAIVLAPVPSERVRLGIHLKIDGRAIATPVDLVVGKSNWTGFEAAGCRFNVVAQEVGDDGVDIELRSPFGPQGNYSTWHENVPYSQKVPAAEDAEADAYGDRDDPRVWTTVVDGRLVDTDGEWHDVELRMTAHKLDYARDLPRFGEESN